MILRADARNIPLRDGCVQTCVTSPPYWGLRDYGVSGQIGLEPTPEAYVATMVGVFREVRRVLRDDGTVWLNLGDSYCASRNGNKPGQFSTSSLTNPARQDLTHRDLPNREFGDLKSKDLIGIPWRVAFALQADGWYLRSDIVWAKPNPMPESVTDRPTRSHEYIFLLSKSERYFYDVDAIREPAEAEPRVAGVNSRIYQDRDPNHPAERKKGMRRSDMEGYGLTRGTSNPSCSHPNGRNKRDVWTVNSEPTPEAHFATFPQKLIEPCILAGTSDKGCCAECGAPRVRATERGDEVPHHGVNHVADDARAHEPMRANGTRHGNGSVFSTGVSRARNTTGWRPSCAHDASSVPCLVLDPFLGSGTVGKVAERFGRRWVGLELSADYISIAEKRTAQMGMAL